MTRLYGRALSGERVNDYVPDVRFERTSIMGALGVSGVVAPLIFKGTLNGDLFRVYVKDNLASALKSGDNLVLDNCSVHKIKDILEPLTQKGVNVFFLPPYSPDFNPIELTWSKMKSTIRKLKPRTIKELELSIKIALECIENIDCKNWINHCNCATTKS